MRPLLEAKGSPLAMATVAELGLKAGRKLSYMRHGFREWEICWSAKAYTGAFSTLKPGDELN